MRTVAAIFFGTAVMNSGFMGGLQPVVYVLIAVAAAEDFLHIRKKIKEYRR